MATNQPELGPQRGTAQGLVQELLPSVLFQISSGTVRLGGSCCSTEERREAQVEVPGSNFAASTEGVRRSEGQVLESSRDYC